MARAVRRGLVAVVGGIVLLVGGVMLVLPGPGLVVVALGLAILSVEFAWARQLRNRTLEWGRAATGRFRRAPD